MIFRSCRLLYDAFFVLLAHYANLISLTCLFCKKEGVNCNVSANLVENATGRNLYFDHNWIWVNFKGNIGMLILTISPVLVCISDFQSFPYFSCLWTPESFFNIQKNSCTFTEKRIWLCIFSQWQKLFSILVI